MSAVEFDRVLRRYVEHADLRRLLPLLLVSLPAWTSLAQAPLYLVNRATTVSVVDYKFVDSQSFEERDLDSHIATTGRTTWDQVKRILPFLKPTPRAFDPVILQRDVRRLQQFYEQNGFLHADIDYPASQLDTTSNSLRVIFSVREGPPLIVRQVAFHGVDTDDVLSNLDRTLHESWLRGRDKLGMNVGERYTQGGELVAHEETLRWFRNRGYAFATGESRTRVDSAANTVNFAVAIDLGPRSRFDRITVEGNESVGNNVVLRELPFREGDMFSADKLTEGQRDLFGLNLFRLALADLPPQPRDSTVSVHIRLREADPRLIAGRVGYARDDGINLELQWTHRNLLGGGRSFSATFETVTGLLAGHSDEIVPRREIVFSTSLTQPYVVVRKMSLTLAPFLKMERDPQLHPGTGFGEFNRQEYGATTTLLYQRLRFRPISLSYLVSRQQQFTREVDNPTEEIEDRYNRSVLSLAGTIGQADNYFTPASGTIGRPFFETAGLVVGAGVEYLKTGVDLIRYQPITDKWRLVGRVFAGTLWPLGDSKEALDGNAPGGADDSLKYSKRFRDVVFYSPTAGDMRGWAPHLLGPKISKPIVSSEGDTTRYAYEASGGRSKLSASLEARMPFPGLGSLWGTALFMDVAQVSSVQEQAPNGSPIVTDDGGIRVDNFFYSVGAGIRYATPVGFVRLDLAYKINPTPEDLMTAEEGFRFQNQDLFDEPPPEGSFSRRFVLHLTIGQVF